MRSAAYLRNSALVFLLCSVSVILSGCWLWPDDDDEEPSVKTAALSIEVSSTTASIGKPLTFNVTAKTQNTTVKSYSWAFSDGQSFSGPSTSASFATPGRVDVSVNALLDNDTTVTTSASVFIFDGTANADPSLTLPPVIGDVDGDSALNTLDALATAQEAYGTVPLAVEHVEASDIDLDGSTTPADLALVMQAVVREAKFPSAILTPQIYPGSVISLVSPALFDPDAQLEVKVNGLSGTPPIRAALGYATTIAPSALPLTDTTATIELYANGALVDSYEQPLLHVGAVTAEPAADVLQFISELKSVLTSQQTVLTSFLTDSSVAPADQAAAVASSQAGAAMLDKAALDLQTLFASEDGAPLASVFQKALYANGLQEFRAALASSSSPTVAARRAKAMALTGDEVCDTLIPAVCGLKKAADLADTGSTVISAGCSVAAIAAFAGTILDAPPVAAAAIAGFVEICVPLNVAATFGSAVGNLFKPVNAKLSSAAAPTSAGADQTWNVTANVTFLGLQETCGVAGEAATQALVTKVIGNRIVAAVLKGNASLRLLSEVFAKYSDDIYVKLLEQIQSSVSDLLTATKVADAINKVIGSVCPNLNAGAAPVPVRRVFTTQPPTGQGILQYNADDSGTYFCPPAGPVFQSNVTLAGQLQLCDATPATTKVDIKCSTAEVTITMGDNGSALDDIFEVVIDGATVLTSSQPVRSTSTTVFLPKGRTTITMRGLAAPDGVGTYFISFSGAALVSGQTSGTDLVPGASKQFVVEVF